MNSDIITPRARFLCVLDSRVDELPRLVNELTAWCALAGVPGKVLASVDLMLDELVTNIVMHGYGGRPGSRIEVDAWAENNSLVVQLTDHAFAFDPLTVAPPDTSLDIDARPIGGLGIHFVRQLADSVEYQRVDIGGKPGNRLRITKRYPPD